MALYAGPIIFRLTLWQATQFLLLASSGLAKAGEDTSSVSAVAATWRISTISAIPIMSDPTAQPLVLGLEILQALDLVALETAKLLAPAVIRGLGHADRTHGVGNALPLRD